jgi:hypothetical protein
MTVTAYSMFCDERLETVFAATSLAEAAAYTSFVQASLNRQFSRDEAYHVREATPAEVRQMPEGVKMLPEMWVH